MAILIICVPFLWSFIEFKLSLLKSNISHPGLVLHMHIHGCRVHWHMTKSHCSTIHETTLFHKDLVSTSHSLSQVCIQSFHSRLSAQHVTSSTQYPTVSFHHPPTHFLYYIVYSHIVLPYLDWKRVRIGCVHARFLIFLGCLQCIHARFRKTTRHT